MFDQQQGDEQTTHPSIPVEKGMNCLELGMDQRCVHQRGQGLVVEKSLPLA
jgi:hypothetical protein